MEASFPDRDNVLRKYSLSGFFIVVLFVAATIGCEPKKEYVVAPVPAFSKILRIDSSYTKIRVISTGGSDSLYCGKKDIFDSYALVKFDSIKFASIAENFDSLFIRLKSPPLECELTFFAIDQKWSEDSVYEWDSIGSLFDTLSPIKIATITGPFASTVDTNPLIFLGDSISLNDSTVDKIGNFGLAIHSDPFHSFGAGKTKLRAGYTLIDTVEEDSFVTEDKFSSIYCTEDAYLVKNPFQDSIISDSLLVGRGLSIRSHIFIPRDSLPLYLHSVAKAELILDLDKAFAFPIFGSVMGVSGYDLADSTAGADSLIFEDMAGIFQRADIDSLVHIQLRASNEGGGIDIGKLGGGIIKFVWVELPR